MPSSLVYPTPASFPSLVFPTILQRLKSEVICMQHPFPLEPLSFLSQGAAKEGPEGVYYLLPLEHVSEGSHLAVLVCPKDLAQRAGGHLAV